MKTKTANVVKKFLDVILRNEVVTVSSPILYQEKTPDNLYERVVEREKGKITDWLIRSNVIQAEDRDLYDYACSSLVFLLAPFVIALVVGMVFRMVAEALLMAVPYVVLRSFCGGFHLKSIKLCLVVSTLSYLAIFSIGVLYHAIYFIMLQQL